MTSFKIGDTVFCRDGEFVFDKHVPVDYKWIRLPKEGKVYTVREVVQTEAGIGVRLKEIVNPEIYHSKGGWQEPVFALDRFKKV